VTLRVVLECILGMSTCPLDMIPINGAACTPTEVDYRFLTWPASKPRQGAGWQIR
jgi:hypothetical protein